MTDADFLRVIAADPGSISARMVYADWLEETGRFDRAEVLRCEVELAFREWDCPGCHSDLSRPAYCHEGCVECDEHSTVRRRLLVATARQAANSAPVVDRRFLGRFRPKRRFLG
jgi:uncharacterized protein (TIGR02996 family)